MLMALATLVWLILPKLFDLELLFLVVLPGLRFGDGGGGGGETLAGRRRRRGRIAFGGQGASGSGFASCPSLSPSDFLCLELAWLLDRHIGGVHGFDHLNLWACDGLARTSNSSCRWPTGVGRKFRHYEADFHRLQFRAHGGSRFLEWPRSLADTEQAELPHSCRRNASQYTTVTSGI